MNGSNLFFYGFTFINWNSEQDLRLHCDTIEVSTDVLKLILHPSKKKIEIKNTPELKNTVTILVKSLMIKSAKLKNVMYRLLLIHLNFE